MVAVRIWIAWIDGFSWAVLGFLWRAMLTLTVLAWLSGFHFGSLFSGFNLWAEADLATSKRFALFLLLLGYQLFIFYIFLDPLLMSDILLLLSLLFKRFLSLFCLYL